MLRDGALSAKDSSTRLGAVSSLRSITLTGMQYVRAASSSSSRSYTGTPQGGAQRFSDLAPSRSELAADGDDIVP